MNTNRTDNNRFHYNNENTDFVNPVFTTENSNALMFEQSVTPPPHVWEKIARALDQQDSQNSFNYLKNNVTNVTADRVRKKIYYTAVAITAFSCLFLLGK